MSELRNLSGHAENQRIVITGKMIEEFEALDVFSSVDSIVPPWTLCIGNVKLSAAHVDAAARRLPRSISAPTREGNWSVRKMMENDLGDRLPSVEYYCCICGQNL